MADPSLYPDSNGDTGVGHDRGSPTGTSLWASTPLWVKVFGTIAIALVLVFLILKLTGLGGEHGPSRHRPSGDAGGPPPIEQEVRPDGPGGHAPPIQHGP